MADEQGVRPTHLLLLPPPPSPVTFPSLKAAYSPALTAVLKQLTFESRKSTLGSIVDIVLPCPLLHAHPDASRTSLYSSVQALVAGVYKLLCVIAAKGSFNIEDREGVDARIVLLSHPRSGDVGEASEQTKIIPFGPVIDLRTLALSQRPWKYVFVVDGEEGEKLLKQFLVLQDAHMKIQRIPGGLVNVEEGSSADAAGLGDAESRHYHSAILGGTFDHLHIGHKLLLTMFAFVLQQGTNDTEYERCYTIGITDDEMLKNKKYAAVLESWQDRQTYTAAFMNAILDFRTPQDLKVDTEELTESGPNGHAIHDKLDSKLILKYVEIQDPYGPTITVEDIAAIVISAETRSGGKAVNEKRSEKGWHQLDVFEVAVLDPEDPEDNQRDNEPSSSHKDAFEAKVSSTKIRQALSERGKQRRKT